MFAVLALLPHALELAPGTWAGSRPRASRVVAIEAPPPDGFVWGSAVDELEQLASTAKVHISDDRAEAADKLKALQEQGLRAVQARANRQKGYADWVAKAEAAAAAQAAKELKALQEQGWQVVQARADSRKAYADWMAKGMAASAAAAAERATGLRAQGARAVQERMARQAGYKDWVAAAEAAAAVVAAEKIKALRLQGDRVVQERMARRSGCMDWIATREAAVRLDAVVKAAARLDANEAAPPTGSEAGQSERGEGGVSADEHNRERSREPASKLPQLRLGALRKEGEAVIARRAAVGEMLERHLAQRQAPKTVWPDDDDAWIGVLGAGLGGPIDEWGKQLPPTWTDLTQVPVRVPNQAAWNSLGRAKQLAILCRLSVVHLTVISCGVPCMLAGATGTATGLVAPLVWVVSLIMWHLSHNMINDAQDLRRGLDENRNAFRLQYGTHALAEGFVSTRSFGITLGAISAAAVAGSALLAGKLAPACAWAFPVGLAATLLYTPLAKPFGLGELLVLLVWGPAMFGGGWSAATGIPAAQVARSVPVALGAFGMIMGKHIDKLDECRDEGVNTLPVLLGDKRARALAAAALVGQHVSLIALVAARKMPPGALLALAAAPFELRGALDVLRNGRPATAAGAKPSYRGSMLPFVPARSWPLWHVAAAGWHAVTFGYWLMAGLGVSWAARAFCLAFQ
jgi:1,4-dihydroxy-2-naphthoate octaprenyltransferase